MKYFSIIFLSAFVFVFFSCQKGKELKTKSGMKYRVYREANGKKPNTGDWVTVNMVYSDNKNSVLFDSRKFGKPLRFALPAPKFIGSFEEGIACIGEGDSATFFISADSMFEKVISKEANDPLKNRPEKGSVLKFDVSLERVQSSREAEMEIAMNESKQEQAEKKALEEYMKEKNIPAEKQPEGYYLNITTAGKGKLITAGTRVSVIYSGYFLNGAVFDSNVKSPKPYSFTAGRKEVMKTWDWAIQKLHEGDKATLIIPSSLAYGSEGIKKPNTFTYFIPPFSTLIYEIEVVKSEAMAKK